MATQANSRYHAPDCRPGAAAGLLGACPISRPCDSLQCASVGYISSASAAGSTSGLRNSRYRPSAAAASPSHDASNDSPACPASAGYLHHPRPTPWITEFTTTERLRCPCLRIRSHQHRFAPHFYVTCVRRSDRPLTQNFPQLCPLCRKLCRKDRAKTGVQSCDSIL